MCGFRTQTISKTTFLLNKMSFFHFQVVYANNKTRGKFPLRLGILRSQLGKPSLQSLSKPRNFASTKENSATLDEIKNDLQTL